MLSVICGGRIVDPTQNRDEPADIWFEDGRIVAPPSDGRDADDSHDATGAIVLAGGIDIHSHIAGFNVNTARLLLPEQRRNGLFDAAPVCFDIGRLYAAMGFTLVVEPAVLPHHALQAQLELACIPLIDKAILTVLGNEDFLLQLLRDGESGAAVADYAARVLAGARALGAKTINPGGAAAFKANARSFNLDDEVPGYGISSRAIMQALQRAVVALGLPHPLHLHTNNLGLPGNVATAMRDDRRRRRVAAALGAFAVLFVRNRRAARLFLRGAAVCRGSERASSRHGRCGSGYVRPDRHDFL